MLNECVNGNLEIAFWRLIDVIEKGFIILGVEFIVFLSGLEIWFSVDFCEWKGNWMLLVGDISINVVR